MSNTFSLYEHRDIRLPGGFRVRDFASGCGADTVLICPRLVELLIQLRARFGDGLRINSAYRTPSHNAAVNGSPHSQHLRGTAADIRFSGTAPQDIAEYAEYLLTAAGGIGLYGTFVHVDTRAGRSRFRVTGGHTVAVAGFPGYVPPSAAPGSFAATAWAWAHERGITRSDNPQGTPTREQVVTMLHRYHLSK